MRLTGYPVEEVLLFNHNIYRFLSLLRALFKK